MGSAPFNGTANNVNSNLLLRLAPTAINFAVWRPRRTGERKLIRMLSRGEFFFVRAINIGHDHSVTVLTWKTSNESYLETVW